MSLEFLTLLFQDKRVEKVISHPFDSKKKHKSIQKEKIKTLP